MSQQTGLESITRSPFVDQNGIISREAYYLLKGLIDAVGGYVGVQHNSLGGIQGGATNDYQHLTTQQARSVDGNSVMIWLDM